MFFFHGVKERTVSKQVHLRNRTVAKMIWWEGLAHMILEIVTVLTFMTSNYPWKKRWKNWKRHLWATEQYRRWAGRNGWFTWFLKLVLSSCKLMMSNHPHKKRGKNWENEMQKIEPGTRWALEKVISNYYLILSQSYNLWHWILFT